MQPAIRIVLADDHPIFRAGLRSVIAADPQLKIVAEAASGEAALDCVRAHKPEVALLDVHFKSEQRAGEPKPLDGYDVARAIRDERLRVAVVFLTQLADERSFNDALNAGAQGYLLKDSVCLEVNECLRAVAAGQDYVSPALTTYRLNRHRRTAALAAHLPALATLSPTEHRILQLLAENRTNQQIAAALCLAVRTIEHHRENICRKLDLKGHHALLHFAIEHRSDL